MDEKMTFEQKMLRLEKITALLESGEAGLEDSLGLFSEGAKLLADCHKTLDTAQLRVEKMFVERNTNERDD